MDVSAVCQYQIGEVKKVFDGPYKEYREGSQRWGRYTGTVPSPRPGAVSDGFVLVGGGERYEGRGIVEEWRVSWTGRRESGERSEPTSDASLSHN